MKRKKIEQDILIFHLKTATYIKKMLYDTDNKRISHLAANASPRFSDQSPLRMAVYVDHRQRRQ